MALSNPEKYVVNIRRHLKQLLWIKHEILTRFHPLAMRNSWDVSKFKVFSAGNYILGQLRWIPASATTFLQKPWISCTDHEYPRETIIPAMVDKSPSFLQRPWFFLQGPVYQNQNPAADLSTLTPTLSGVVVLQIQPSFVFCNQMLPIYNQSWSLL